MAQQSGRADLLRRPSLRSAAYAGGSPLALDTTMPLLVHSKVVDNIRLGYFALLLNQRLYSIAAVLLVLSFGSYAIFWPETSRGFFILFLGFLFSALTYDSLNLYKKIYATLVGKTALVLLLSICTNLALALSCQVLNDVTGTDPTKFPRTIAMLSIFWIPVLSVAGLALLLSLAIGMAPILVLFHMLADDSVKRILLPDYVPKPPIPYLGLTRVTQLVAVIFVCSLVWSYSRDTAKDYDAFLNKTAGSLLYQWEMYAKAPCAIDPSSRVAFLTDDQVLVGTKTPSGVTFLLKQCKRSGA